MEEKGIVPVCRLTAVGALPPEESSYQREVGPIGEMTLTRSELTAVYWKHLSRLPPEFVITGDVERSAGGSITTS